MADEVSKKDLQALEKNFNKQIADLQKQLEEQKKEFNKGLDEENKITVNVRQDLEKQIEAFEPDSLTFRTGSIRSPRRLGI